MRKYRHRDTGTALRVIAVMSPALLLGLNLLVFGTFAVFGENRGEFLVSYQNMLQNYYLPALAVFLIFALPPMFFDHRVSRAYNAVLILIGVLTYIHGNLILWNTGVLDGTHLDLSKTWRSVVDVLLWVTLAGAAYRYRSWLLLHGWRVCVALILFQTIGVLFVLSHGQDKNQPLVVGFPKELAAFSKNSNVIHIILDGYQASVFEQLLTEQPGLTNDFSGFTFFRDASTSSAITYLSVPAALSGKAFKNDQLISAYQEQALRGYNLFSFLAHNGYSLDVATPAWWNKSNDLFASYYRIPEPYADEHGTLLSTALLLADISLYRQTPHFLKSTIYRSGAWLLSGWLVATPEQQFDHFAHTAFFMDLIDKLTVVPSGPRYKFIHLVTPHAPLVTLADCSFAGAALEYSRDAFVQQSRCTLKNLVSLLKKLKISGAYDNSLLIVHGDHGGGVAFDMVGENGVKTNSTEALSHMWGNPLPLVLIKPRFESGKLKISNQPVELLDLPSTVAHQLALEGNFPGHSIV